MSRIDGLIAELAPDGIEFRPIDDVISSLRTGLNPRQNFKLNPPGATNFYMTVRELGGFDLRPTAKTDRVDDDGLRLIQNRAKLRPGDVLFSATGTIGRTALVRDDPHDWNIKEGVYAITPRPECIDPRFMIYLLHSSRVRAQVLAQADGSTVASIPMAVLRRLPIPVPPLEVQREIVRILDQFTQLETELEAELEARRRQYEHYRQRLIDEVKAPRVSIRSLGQWRGGITPSKSNATYWDGGDIPWLASMDVSDESTNEIRGRVTSRALDETSLKVVAAPSVPVVMRSNILRRRLPIGYVDIDTTVNQDIRALVPGDGVSARYIYQVLRADSERIRSTCVRTDGSMAAVDSKLFFEWTVPLPSLEEQASIAARLDHFDSLVNDLSVGLPAELAARRKQYEYYRNKLLTFEEATV